MAGLLPQVIQNLQGLQGLEQGKMQMEQYKQQQADMQAASGSLQDYYKTGNQQSLINATLKSPQLAGQMLTSLGLDDERKQQQAATDVAELWQLRSNPEAFKQKGLQRIDAIMQRGGNPTDTINLLMAYDKDPKQAEMMLQSVGAGLEASGFKTGVFDNDAQMTPYQAESLALRRQELDAQERQRQASAEARGNALNNERAKADIAVDSEGRKLKLQQGVKDFTDITKSRAAAAKQMNALSQLSKLSPAAFEGSFSGTKMFLSRLAGEAGMDISGLPESEAFAAVANEAVLGKAQQMSGALSNADMVFLQNTAPALMQTAEGRRKIIEYGQKLAQRDIDYAKAAQDFRKRKGYFDLAEFQDEFDAEGKSLFKDESADFRKKQFTQDGSAQPNPQPQQPTQPQGGFRIISVKGGQ